MSIEFIKGDAVEALKNGDVDYLIHCCNAQGKMNSGIAKQIREEFPEAYDIYKHSVDNGFTDDVLMGSFTIEKGVVNLIGQKYYGYHGKRYVHYGHIANGLHRIGLKIQSYHNKRRPIIAIPYKFASDRAGGDWEIILELIEASLSLCFDVKIYHLENL